MKKERKRLILFWLGFCSLFGAWKIVGLTVICNRCNRCDISHRRERGEVFCQILDLNLHLLNSQASLWITWCSTSWTACLEEFEPFSAMIEGLNSPAL